MRPGQLGQQEGRADRRSALHRLVVAGAANPVAAPARWSWTGRGAIRRQSSTSPGVASGRCALHVPMRRRCSASACGPGCWPLPGNAVAPFALFVPVAGIASAALFLGETISGLEIAGSFAGVLRPPGQRLRAAPAGAQPAEPQALEVAVDVDTRSPVEISRPGAPCTWLPSASSCWI